MLPRCQLVRSNVRSQNSLEPKQPASYSDVIRRRNTCDDWVLIYRKYTPAYMPTATQGEDLNAVLENINSDAHWMLELLAFFVFHTS